jgi:hypothetical protein
MVSDATSRIKRSFGSWSDERRFKDKVLSSIGHTDHWATEPAVGRVAHGVPHRVDRLRGLGNGQVPQVVEWIASMIKAIP